MIRSKTCVICKNNTAYIICGVCHNRIWVGLSRDSNKNGVIGYIREKYNDNPLKSEEKEVKKRNI